MITYPEEYRQQTQERMLKLNAPAHRYVLTHYIDEKVFSKTYMDEETGRKCEEAIRTRDLETFKFRKL